MKAGEPEEMRSVPVVLLVDNEQGMLVLFGNLLQRMGYDVRLAASGEEALTWLEHETPDLLILDMAMPGINGMDVLHYVIDRPELDGMTVMVLTALGPVPAPSDVAQRITRWVTKPVEPQRLVHLVHELLSDE